MADTPAPDPGGPHVPLAALILSIPASLVVALLCILERPGILFSLLAIALTPVVVFAVLLGGFVIRDRLRAPR